MASKQQRQTALTQLLRDDPEKFQRLYEMRCPCPVPEESDDESRIAAILNAEFPLEMSDEHRTFKREREERSLNDLVDRLNREMKKKMPGGVFPQDVMPGKCFLTFDGNIVLIVEQIQGEREAWLAKRWDETEERFEDDAEVIGFYFKKEINRPDEGRE